MTETLDITVRYRPLRIGFCVENQDFDALRKAIRSNNVLWGGRFNPIIPIDNEELAKQLISTFRVDVLFPISNTEKVKEFIKKFDYLPSPFFGEELFPKFSDTHRESAALDVYHAIRSIYEKFFQNVPEPKIKLQIYKWHKDDPLKDIFLMTFGEYPEKEATPIDYQNILEKNLSAKIINISPDQEHPSNFFDNLTPHHLTEFDLKEHYSIQNYWSYHGFYLGNCENFEDLISYWNLRAAGIDILFYDPSKAERFKNLKDDYTARILSMPEHPARGKSKVSLWSKEDIRNKDHSEFGNELILCSIYGGIWSSLNFKAPYMYFLEKSILGTIHKGSEKTSLSFQLPDKPFYDEPILSRQHIVISIDTGIGLFTDEKETLDIPYLPELNEYYGREYYFHWRQVRAEPESIGIIEKIGCNSLKLYALKIDDLLAEIFKIRNIDVAPSQAGIVCRHLIHQMGGLRSCRVFRISGLRNLIKKHKVTESFTRSGAKIAIGKIENGKTNFSNYENLFIEQRDINTKLKPENVLDFLLKKKAFRAGLEFNCPSCRLDFWLSLDDVKNDISCEYCGNNFDSNIQLKDRDWRYRRSGLLGKDNNQEGAIPVIMLLEQLISSSSFRRKYLYVTAKELKSPENQINCETDFILLRERNRDGKMQIAIGECKNGEEISEDDVRKIKAVVESLKARFDVYVIFVKLAGFTPAELERFEVLNEEYRTRLILFTANDLESSYIYEAVKENPNITNKYAFSFEDMANITKQLYYSEISS